MKALICCKTCTLSRVLPSQSKPKVYNKPPLYAQATDLLYLSVHTALHSHLALVQAQWFLTMNLMPRALSTRPTLPILPAIHDPTHLHPITPTVSNHPPHTLPAVPKAHQATLASQTPSILFPIKYSLIKLASHVFLYFHSHSVK
ncbi:hypothetical protein CLU79DRAFT_449568 [Phycomyces nitens]|nr:hypothetical protein CLU79DRAFT_449568 [Phycomyces nitens]